MSTQLSEGEREADRGVEMGGEEKRSKRDTSHGELIDYRAVFSANSRDRRLRWTPTQKTHTSHVNLPKLVGRWRDSS